ncbi:heme-dependent catalase [Auricularia subglabra TFB-10046 SS5]|nr:heme-dependent catalase [Auricularia subglabra TFB-10046 SS5]
MASSQDDPSCTQLAGRLVEVLDRVSGGEHRGFRANHARGVLLTGSFTPTRAASALCSAPHFAAGTTTPVLARFSSSTGIPTIPDTAPDAQPLGLAVRFHLPGGAHTDIIAHNTQTFPARTGEELVQFFEAKLAGPAQLNAFPAAQAFLAALALPRPASFATTAYFALTAFRFVAAARFVRYSFVPVAGMQTAPPDAGPSYLYEELAARGTVAFELWAQLAEDGDVTDDITARWPADRERVLLGTIVLDAIPENSPEVEREIVFDPLPRVQGIEPSADPLLALRSAVYAISGARRREARCFGRRVSGCIAPSSNQLHSWAYRTANSVLVHAGVARLTSGPTSRVFPATVAPPSAVRAPPELLWEIFQHLPLADRAAMAGVCRSWRAALNGCTLAVQQGITLRNMLRRTGTAPLAFECIAYSNTAHTAPALLPPRARTLRLALAAEGGAAPF